ncbi:MAG TPA: hypothetical protein VHM20_06945, partial [Gammaproteobacteria bacterium]|nr:hypothetical protein [Gammaproteobacteria bacterium]
WWALKKVGHAVLTCLKKVGNVTLDVLGIREIGIAKTRDYYRCLHQFFFNAPTQVPLAKNVPKWRPGILGYAFLAGSALVMFGGGITGLNHLAFKRTAYYWQGIKHRWLGGAAPNPADKVNTPNPGLLGGAFLFFAAPAAICWWALKKIGHAAVECFKKLGNFVFKCLKKTVVFCGKILANILGIIGVSSYAYYNVIYTLKKCANFLFAASFNVAYELSYMKKVKDQHNFASVCSQINILGWVMKGVIGTVTGVMALIGLSATNWHRMHIWWMNRTNAKLAEDINAKDDRLVDTTAEESYFTYAHGDALSRFLSQYNLIRLTVIALKEIAAPLFVGTVAICIAAVRNFVYKPLKLLFTPLSWCCPKPKTELNQLVTDLNTFHDRLNANGSLPGVIDPKIRAKESKDQPGSQYAKSVADCYQDLTTKKASFCERVTYWLSKEARIATSFALPNVQERVIAEFKDAAEEYAKREGASLHGFLTDCYQQVIANVESRMIKKSDKENVKHVAWAIRYALLQKEGIQEEEFNSNIQKDFDEWSQFSKMPPAVPKPTAPLINPDDFYSKQPHHLEVNELYRKQFGDASAPLADIKSEGINRHPECSDEILITRNSSHVKKEETRKPSFLQRISFFAKGKEVKPLIPRHLILNTSSSMKKA